MQYPLFYESIHIAVDRLFSLWGNFIYGCAGADDISDVFFKRSRDGH